MPEDRELVVKMVREKCAAVGIDLGEALRGKMPERIAYAADDRFGRCCEIVLAALHMAYRRGDKVLTVDQFATAYERRSHAFGYAENNVFLSSNFEGLRKDAQGNLRFSEDRSLRSGRDGLLDEAAEAALTGCQVAERRPDVVGAEIRPHAVDEKEFRVSAFPQHEVAEAFFAAGAD